jgi:hypothetical protein
VNTRRQTFLIIAWAVIGRGSARAASLADLSELGKALGDAAEAIGKLGDSIAHLTSLGTRGWDVLSARRTRARLKDISARLVIVNALGNFVIISNLDTYIDNWNRYTQSGRIKLSEPSLDALKTDWFRFVSKVTEILNDVTQLLAGIENERSDLVTQSVYRDLVSTLGGRVTLLQRLHASEAPVSIKEIAALKVVVAEYQKLADNLKNAILALNAYVSDQSD